VVQDISVAGLNLQPDMRTNSIIAVGSEARIKTVEELIALLDVPDGGLGEQKMMTFTLETVSPQQAATELGKLFQNVEATRKPTIIPLQDQGKLTITGPSSLLLQAVALLGELDPGTKQGEASRTPERRASIVRLTLHHAADGGADRAAAAHTASEFGGEVRADTGSAGPRDHGA
jgi:type II secretory pathway component GspD/PulD (secretin)